MSDQTAEQISEIAACLIDAAVGRTYPKPDDLAEAGGLLMAYADLLENAEKVWIHAWSEGTELRGEDGPISLADLMLLVRGEQ